MECKGPDYRVWMEPGTSVVCFQGVLRLPGVQAYQEITDLLTRAADAPSVTLDVRALQFLNSAGINMMYKFALSLRNKGAGLIVKGSNDVGWQSKSLRNLGRFVDSFELHFDGATPVPVSRTRAGPG